MNNQTKTWATVIGVILLVAAFYGGMVYGQHRATSSALAARTAARGGYGGTGATGGFAGRGGAGGLLASGSTISSGTVLSMTSSTITLKLQDGSSVVILADGSTPVTKTVAGATKDIAVNGRINVIGTKNSDGSITATSISIPSTTMNGPMIPAGGTPSTQTTSASGGTGITY